MMLGLGFGHSTEDHELFDVRLALDFLAGCSLVWWVSDASIGWYGLKILLIDINVVDPLLRLVCGGP